MNRDAEHQLMRRAIALASAAFGSTRPNPVVGCVIARDGTVLAEGVTQPGGRPHAEETALAALGGQARGAVAYVTLEPCGARSSPVPSCSERLVAAGVARVVAAWEDASPFAAGQGAERLRQAGVPVEMGLLRDEAAGLYEGYAHRLRTGMPLVIAAADTTGCEALFEPGSSEDLEKALLRYGESGFTRLWTPLGGDLAQTLTAQGLLHRGR